MSELELGRWVVVLYLLLCLISIFRLVTIVSNRSFKVPIYISVLQRVVREESY